MTKGIPRQRSSGLTENRYTQLWVKPCYDLGHIDRSSNVAFLMSEGRENIEVVEIVGYDGSNSF